MNHYRMSLGEIKGHYTVYTQGRLLGVASGATAPDPALEGALRFRPTSWSSYILR